MVPTKSEWKPYTLIQVLKQMNLLCLAKGHTTISAKKRENPPTRGGAAGPLLIMENNPPCPDQGCLFFVWFQFNIGVVIRVIFIRQTTNAVLL